MKKPLVSVIMATFNEKPQYIEESIGSLINQSYENLEILVADDSSNQQTIHTIDKLAGTDERIHIIRDAQRMGFVPALNKAMQECHGEFVARMDGDDISLKDRIEKEVNYLISHPEIDVIGGFMNIIDGESKLIAERVYPLGGFKLTTWTLFRSPFAHPTVMMRRKVIEDNNFYDADQKKAEDIEFWLRLKNKGYKFANIPQKLLNYRVVNSLGTKRNKDQWIYNYRARYKNFSWHNPLFSIMSLMVSSIYVLLPQSLFNWYYDRENRY